MNIHDVGLVEFMMMFLLGMYEVVYACHIDIWSKLYVCGLLVSELSMCDVMGLHMYIALVGLDWDYE